MKILARAVGALLPALFWVLTSGVQAEPFKVGVSLPLSGFAAAYGTALRQGLTLFNEEHPEAAQRLLIIYDDHQYDGGRTVASVRKLSEVDRVNFLVVWGVTPSGVAAPLADSLAAPMLTVTTEPVAKGRPTVASFRLMAREFTRLIREVLARDQLKRFALVGINIGAVLEIVKEIKQQGVQFVSEDLVDSSATDFRTLIMKLKKAQADSLLLVLGPQQMAPFARQAAELRFSAHAISGDLLADDEARTAVRDFLGPVTYFYGSTTPEFKARYRARWGTTSNIYEAATGYTAGELAWQLAQKAQTSPGLNAAAIIKQFSTIDLTNSVVGRLKFENTPDFGMNAAQPLVVIDDRK